MLVLSRKCGEGIVIDGCIRIEVIQSRGNRVSIGISAPDDVSIKRAEVLERERQEGFEEFNFPEEISERFQVELV